MPTVGSRPFRPYGNTDEILTVRGAESEPFLNNSCESRDLEPGYNVCEDGDIGAVSADKDASLESIELSRSPRKLNNRSPHNLRLWSWLRYLSDGFRRRRRNVFPNLDISSRSRTKKTSLSRRCLRFIPASLMFLGSIQLLTLLVSLWATIFPETLDDAYKAWIGQPGVDKDDDDLRHWPTDWTADVVPVKCHSHNDYWRKIPLKSAIRAGCTGVEADVWLVGGELYVGHIESSLTASRTFNSLYINPLVELLEHQNPVTDFHPTPDTPRHGVFDTEVDRELILLVDFKTTGRDLWPVVSAQLEPLRSRQYLTHFDGSLLIKGPVTVVVTGNAPFDLVVANSTYRDMFFDAPLDDMELLASNPPATDPSVYDAKEELSYLSLVQNERSKRDPISSSSDQGQGHSGISPTSPTVYSPFNSYYASTSLQESIGIPFPYFTSTQRQRLQSQLAGAHSLGLQARYWAIPAWPISWRNYLWRQLVSEGIDYLNVDDLKGATHGRWLSVGIGRTIWGDGGW